MAAPRTRSIHQVLLSAARAGDGDAVRQALAAGANPLFQDGRGDTAVLCACKARSPGALEVLVDAGFAPLGTPRALDDMLKSGHAAVFEKLLTGHPARFAPHLTLLRTAALEGHIAIIRAWPAASPKDVRRLWQMIAETDMALPQAGADALWARFPVDPAHPLHRQVFEHGVRRGTVPQGIIEQMDAGVALEKVPGTYLTGIEVAMAQGATAVVRRFLDRMKAAPKAWTLPRPTFFEELCFTAAVHASRSLVEAVGAIKKWDGAALATLGTPSGTLLHALGEANADMPRRVGLARFLLAHGADANAPNATGQTPLHRASETTRSASRGLPTLVEVLDAAGASWDARDEQGKTPLDLMRHQAQSAHWKVVLEARSLDGELPRGPARSRHNRF